LRDGIGGRRTGRGRRGRLAATAALATLCGSWPAAGLAAGEPAAVRPEDEAAPPQRLAQAGSRRFDIPAQPLAPALLQFGRQAGVQVAVDAALMEGRRTLGIAGTMTVEEALRGLLGGTGLTFEFASERAVTVRPLSGAVPPAAIALQPIAVEGSLARPRFGDAPPEPGGFKADYQATATKTPLPLKSTPQAVTVTTRESIESREARDITSALELTAGVGTARAADGGPFAGRGLGGGEGFVLRGQELDGKRDVRIDSFVVSSNAFDLAPFERIEVIKGPSSTLFGQGSLGGFINLVRKKPQPVFAASATALAGSFATRRAEGDVTGPLDAGGRALGRLVVAYDDSGAFIDGVETRVAVVAPSLQVELGERTRALVELLYQDDEYTPSRGLPLRLEGTQLKIPNISRELFTGVPSQEKSNSQNLLATLRVDHEVSDRWLGTLLLQTGGQSRERFFDAYSNAGYLDTGGDVYMYSDRSATEDFNWAGELRIDGRFDAFGREHRVLAGFEHNELRTDLGFGYTYLGPGNLYDREFAADNILPGGAGSQAFDFDISTTSRNTAPFVQLALSLTERTQVLLGARYDRSEIDRTNNITGAVDSKKDEELTFRVGLSHAFTDNVTAYGIYAQSFEPSVNARSVSGGILEPVTGEGFEVGVKTEWFDGRLGITAAAFEQLLDKVPISDPADRRFQINGGLQRTHGLELEVTGSPLPGLTVGGAATFLDSEFIDVRDDNFGLSPDGTERQFSLFGRYELQEGALKGVGFGASVVSVGDRLVLGVGMNERMEGYERVDFSLFYTGFEGIDLSLYVRNAFDERYIERLRDRFQDNFFGSPRAVLVRARATF